MKTKKIIIVSIFLVIIAITAIYTIIGAIKSYNYDMDPANGIDIMEGVGAAMLIVLGGFVVFYELDLFYTVYYFFFKPKTIVRSIINVLANVSLLLVFFCEYIASALSVGEEWIVLFAFLGAYALLRLVSFMISIRDDLENNNYPKNVL